MKKSLLAITMVTLLLFVGISVFSSQNASLNKSGLTLETLVAKAQAAAVAKAEEGRYLYLNVKVLSSAKGSTSLTSKILDTWTDTESADYIEIEKNSSTNQVVGASVLKAGIRYSYKADGTFLSQNQDENSTGPGVVIKSVAEGLKAYIESGNDMEALKTVFTPYVDIKSVEYLGQSTLNSKTVEGIVFKATDTPIEVKLYFDAATFELVSIQEVNKEIHKIIHSVDVISSSYSNEVPQIQLGNTLLSLNP